jgi:hypothetical protein
MNLLRQIEVVVANEKTTAQAWKEAGTSSRCTSVGASNTVGAQVTRRNG